MHPVFVAFGQYQVPSYVVGQIAAIVTVAFYAHHRRRQVQLPASIGLDLGLIVLAAILFGGRLEWLRQTGTELTMASAWWIATRGGFSFFGVLAIALPATALYARRHGLPVLSFWDALVPALPLGLAVYRLGCVAAGCCYGTPCSLPWAITYPDHPWTAAPAGIPLHPTPVYELLGSLVLFAVARHTRPSGGAAIAKVLAGFLVLRLAVDLGRGDSADRYLAPDLLGPVLTQAQGWCLLGLAAIAAAAAFQLRSAREVSHG